MKRKVHWMFYSRITSNVLNGALYMMWGNIINRACQKALVGNLPIWEGITMLLSEMLSTLVYVKYSNKLDKVGKYLLILDLIVFWALALTPELDLKYYAFISAIDGCLVLNLWSNLVNKYELKCITKHRWQKYNLYLKIVNFGIRLDCLLYGFIFANVLIQTMLVYVMIFSTPGSWYSYKRYLKLKELAAKKETRT